ncbi:MAG: rod shape-determining protein MreD [Pseudomonadota bacterium]
MRLFLGFSATGLLFLCIETTLFNYFSGVPVKPDLILVMVVYLGIFRGPIIGIVLAFTLGYLMDTLSGSIIGLYSFLRIITFLLTKLACVNFYLNSVFTQTILVLVLSIVDGIFLLSTLYLFSSIDNLWPFVVKFVPLQSILTGILSPIIFLILNKTDLLLEPR